MEDDFVDKVSALANGNRLQILEWLKNPSAYFGPEHPVDEAEGVCGLYIAEKLGVTPATASVHLKILTAAGFVQPLRIGKYTYFKRVETAFSELADAMRSI
ncbi:ArsR/SmtB family transcription factor [Sinorhizobium mexicanum]|uniref:Winged helix-turn-helix transcriptional regulator n=1 Tax=Sinorhizobium mexicanum TaxID=375549 RepID=A0A859QWB9_9HYPH|nr:winged helix-turn-helix domain-containing protein [Sinorhizobium mexicanum]MBP1881875.1 ArsR family transcriptional regulator [Sinorhizobium mexicanum]QLL61618.1 winged helix-turn-helix transcriptional regulator [Sinorhizobium mexicanum]